MFTRLQKYHKAFLIGVTVLIAASFGMGTVILSLVSKEDITEVATLSGQKITSSEFHGAYGEWNSIYKLALILSPKAKRFKSAPEILSQIQTSRSMQERAGILFHNFAFANPVWDTIFSLKEEMARIDYQLSSQIIDNPVRSRQLFGEEIGMIEEELKYYVTLPEKQRDAMRGVLEKRDIWNLLMLYQQAKYAGIRVTESEIENFIADIVKGVGGEERYREILENERILETSMPKLAETALTVVKYIGARYGGAQTSLQVAYETYAESNVQHRLQWVRFQEDWQKTDDEKYRELRLRFYDEKRQNNPQYFMLPAHADFECVFLKCADLVEEVKEEEVDAEYAKRQERAVDEEEAEAQKAKIREEIKRDQAGEKAKALLGQLREQISAAGADAPLESLAFENNISYESCRAISEENFLKQAQAGTEEARDFIFQKLEVNATSPVLANKKDVYFFVRLDQRTPAKQIAREDIEKDASLFLERYYRNDIKPELDFPERYSVEYVLMDHGVLRQNLLIPTPEMKARFYEKYKELMYPEGQKFEAVLDDMQERMANFASIREMQNFHMVRAKCENPSKPDRLFTVGEEHVQSLNGGMISAELKQEFIRYGYPLVNPWCTKTSDENKWMVQETPKMYYAEKRPDKINIYAQYENLGWPDALFSVSLKYEKDLEKGEVPAQLQEEFQKNGYGIGQAKGIKLEENRWVIQEMPKTYYIEKDMDKLHVYPETAKDVDLAVVVSLIKQAMLVPDSLQYVKTPFLTEEEILQSNPTGDPDFNLYLPPDQLSDVRDSSEGKYFYKVKREHFDSNREFKDLEKNVKEHFLKMQAMKQGRKTAEEIRTRYAQSIEKSKVAWKDNPQKLERLPMELLRTLALEYGLTCHTTAYFKNLQEVKELANAGELNKIIHPQPPAKAMETGEIAPPVEEKGTGSVLLVQMLDQRRPTADEVGYANLERIQSILQDHWYRKELSSLLHYERLKKEMRLEVKDTKYEDFLLKPKRQRHSSK